MFVLKRIFLFGLITLLIVACTTAEVEPTRSAKFSRGMRVQVVADTPSLSLFSDCRTGTTPLVGMANSGDDAVVRGRRTCVDGWWYEVQILALADTEWEGIGWVHEQNLKIR